MVDIPKGYYVHSLKLTWPWKKEELHRKSHLPSMDLQCKLFVSGRVGGGFSIHLKKFSHWSQWIISQRFEKVRNHLGNEQMPVWKKRVRTVHSWRYGVIYQQKTDSFIEFAGGCVSKGRDTLKCIGMVSY